MARGEVNHPYNERVATHHLDPIVGNLHGAFSRDIAPALTIDPGDTVIFRTLDADWNLAPRTSTRYEDPPAKFAPIPAGQETGHARQGDGEVSVTAIECPMEHVALEFELLTDMPLRAPRAHTPTGWVTFGLHKDLNQAALLALEDMVNLMMARDGLTRHQALGLASVLVDLRVTQIVNEVSGVHAVLAHDAYARGPAPKPL